MPAPFFRFKQFTVWHNLCAMKVGTDGVLLGAWTPVNPSVKQVLDIGCGSGLVALMIAQRCNEAVITGIDIDEGAFLQSDFNFRLSPWSNRLRALHLSLQELEQSATLPNHNSGTVLHSSLQELKSGHTAFDLIVSNPPFFSNSLKNPNQSRTTARHNDSLPLNELFEHSNRLLNETGSIVLILPVTDYQKCVKLAESHGFHCTASVVIIPKPNAEPKRILLSFGRIKAPEIKSELLLESGTRGEYSVEFAKLVRDFYLKL